MPDVHILDVQLLTHQVQQLYHTFAALHSCQFVQPLKKQYKANQNHAAI